MISNLLVNRIGGKYLVPYESGFLHSKKCLIVNLFVTDGVVEKST
jgi:hypothetical protein